MRLGNIREIEIKMNPYFFVVLVFFCYFQHMAQVILLVVSVVLHEMAHLLFAVYFRYQISAIEILPFGGVLHMEHNQFIEKHRLICIALAGPVMSLMLAYIGRGNAFFYEANMMLGLFNLLPAIPLDGSKVFRACLSCFFSRRTTLYILLYASYGVCIGLIAKIVYDIWFQGIYQISLLIIVVFLLMQTRKENNNERFFLKKLQLRKKMQLARVGFLTSICYTVHTDMFVHELLKKMNHEQHGLVFILDEQDQIRGIFSELELWEQIVAKGIHIQFGELI